MQRKNTIGCGTKAEGNNPDLLSRKGDIIIIQDHSHGHEQGGQGAHFNVRPEGEKRNGHIGNTKDHYLIHELDEEKIRQGIMYLEMNISGWITTIT